MVELLVCPRRSKGELKCILLKMDGFEGWVHHKFLIYIVWTVLWRPIMNRYTDECHIYIDILHHLHHFSSALAFPSAGPCHCVDNDKIKWILTNTHFYFLPCQRLLTVWWEWGTMPMCSRCWASGHSWTDPVVCCHGIFSLKSLHARLPWLQTRKHPKTTGMRKHGGGISSTGCPCWVLTWPAYKSVHVKFIFNYIWELSLYLFVFYQLFYFTYYVPRSFFELSFGSMLHSFS